MEYYFDTSFLIPLFIPEETSERVERYIRNLPAGSLRVSHWTRVEFASMLARDVRMKVLDEAAAVAVSERFELFLATSFDVFPLRIEDCELARKYLLHFSTGLRAGDAMHLAIAANAGVKALLTLDRGMLKAGKLLKLPVAAGIRL